MGEIPERFIMELFVAGIVHGNRGNVFVGRFSINNTRYTDGMIYKNI